MASYGPAQGPVRLPLLGEYGSNARTVKVAQVIVAAGDSGDATVFTTSTGTSDAFADHFVVGGRDGQAAAASDSNTFVNFFTDTQQADAVDTDGPLDLVVFDGDGGSGSGVVVKDVFLAVETAFTAAVTLIVGDTDDANGWFDDTFGVITSTSQGITTYPTNLDTAGDLAFRLLGGKYYASSSGELVWASAGADIAAGRMGIWIEYFIADNLVYS